MGIQIREATPADFDQIWPIFHQIVVAGETYAYSPQTNRAEAFHLWLEKPQATYVAARDGQILGIYYIKPNQPGLGGHVCNCGYMVAAAAQVSMPLSLCSFVLIRFRGGAVMNEEKRVFSRRIVLIIVSLYLVSVLILFGGIFLRAALPEELMFRVAIQPRLTHFMSIGGAILLQALLFSAAHFPQRYFGYGEPFLLSLGHIFIIENGLIAGYIWYRTRNLPLLLVMHLLAFPRIGI